MNTKLEINGVQSDTCNVQPSKLRPRTRPSRNQRSAVRYLQLVVKLDGWTIDETRNQRSAVRYLQRQWRSRGHLLIHDLEINGVQSDTCNVVTTIPVP